MLKTLPPVILSRQVALSIDAEKLYTDAISRAGTENVRITIQPGRMIDSGFLAARSEFTLPRAPVKVGEQVSSDYEEIQIRIHYSEINNTETGKLYTLEQFVNMTLVKWESFLPHVDVASQRGKQAEFDLINAMDVLKRTYNWDEMFAGANFNTEDFKAYFDVTEGSHHGA